MNTLKGLTTLSPNLPCACFRGSMMSWALSRHTGRGSIRRRWLRWDFVKFHLLWNGIIMKLHQFAMAESLTQMSRNANWTWKPKLSILVFMHEGAPGNGLEGKVLEAGENPPVTLLLPQWCCRRGTGHLALYCSSRFVQEKDCSILKS